MVKVTSFQGLAPDRQFLPSSLLVWLLLLVQLSSLSLFARGEKKELTTLHIMHC